VPVLCRIPLAAEISRGIDRTHPLMAGFEAGAAPGPSESAQGEAFMAIARAVRDRFSPAENSADRRSGEHL
jgi:hypothetical protein